jgi:tetratricopeptide (TPR) repeat protein
MRLLPLAPFLLFSLALWAQPGLPRIDTTNFLPPIRVQVEQAEQQARTHPGDSGMVGVLAMTLHAYQQYDSATRVYSRAHLLEPGKFEWPYLMGTVQMESGEFVAARLSFQAALEISPAALTAALRLAQADVALGRLPEAVAVYRQILQLHAGSPQAWYGLGRAQAAMGEHATAAESYSRACDLFPEYGAAHFALAQELRRTNQAGEAQRHLRAYSANPAAEPALEDPVLQRVAGLNRGAQVHMQRAAELERAGRLEEAVREQEAALLADPVNVQAHVNLIALYALTGSPEKAKANFDAAVRLSPGRSDLWYNYGVLLLREPGDLDNAEKAFRRAIEINPDHAEARDNLGLIYQARGRLDDAVREFRQAVNSHPDYPLARFHLGRVLANQRKYEAAEQQFLRALEPESDRTPAYLYALAATYARAGRRDEAMQYFNKARDAARTRGQSQLLISIEGDIKTLGAGRRGVSPGAISSKSWLRLRTVCVAPSQLFSRTWRLKPV